MAESIAVDGSGNVFVGGYSYAGWGSPSLPFQGWDGVDIFAAKLDGGGALAWNTFLPSTDWAINYWGMGIAVDGAGGVFVTGTSERHLWHADPRLLGPLRRLCGQARRSPGVAGAARRRGFRRRRGRRARRGFRIDGRLAV